MNRGFLNMVSRAEKFRIDLTTSVRHALEDGFIHPNQPRLVAIEGELDIGDLTDRAVDVFAAFLDELHESGGEIPDIKRHDD